MTALWTVLAVAGLLILAVVARRQQAAAMASRAELLDGLSDSLVEPSRSIGPDGFPAVSGRLSDGRPVTAALIVDTLVTRRLPQLWLAVTFPDAVAVPHPTVGALARPTGAEFYSQVHPMPDRLEAPAGLSQALLVRGETTRPDRAAALGQALLRLFADPTLKEITARRGTVRVVRQAAEGERGAHLLLRQIRFPSTALVPDLLWRAAADAEVLAGAIQPAPALASRRSA